ncbi:MAG: GAF domain-containing protein [Actinobacteria bacterium]|nr:GAF domain-containing protein [Actinomycetota bacterium]
MKPRRPGHWFVLLRAALVVVAIVDVALTDFPNAYRPWAWAVTAFFAFSTVVDAWLAYRRLDRKGRSRARVLAVLFDAVAAIGYVAVFSYQAGEPYRALYLVPIAEAALRFGLVGGLSIGTVMVGATLVVDALGSGVAGRMIVSRILVGILAGVVLGRLRDGLAARAAEAERLRDELGRRGDILEAANRCARALASSVEMETAFAAFIRELRAVVPFDRTAIVLIEDDIATTIATAGRGSTEVFPPGSSGPVRGSVLDQVRGGEVIVRRNLDDTEYPEDREFANLGLRSEIVAPLLVGAKPIGMIALSRVEVDAFTPDDIEMVALLGRLAATAVQNIRAYEAEHQTVAELRRLSALRADFVSLVSHELRSPMAAVIGAARTLQERWRHLTPEQREAFLALIADETNRLAILIGDVLHTSQIEAGTFSYSFADVDLGRLVEDAVTTAAIGQDEVRVTAAVSSSLPAIRGDRERLRQVLGNLIENAIKYSPAGGEVQVRAAVENGCVRIAVVDHGPGIPPDQHRLIFEKFGRADIAGASRPGTGLGLFIARSIAEAHGGAVDVRSSPNEGSTFTLTLPAA